jgi:hypothetical protein
MSSPSNLYAEKIFAEHPQRLWALDDKVDYVSIINNSHRDFSSWEIINGSSVSTTEFLDTPFPESIVNKITPESLEGETFSVTLESPDIINVDDINQTLKTFSIGSYFYTQSPYVLGVELGYRYYDSVLSSYVDVLRPYDVAIRERWIFLSETFSPDFDNSQIKIIIKFNFLFATNDVNDYLVYSNGLTFGQWSEEFHSHSLGITTSSLPSTISLESSQVIPADAYGLTEDCGYYFSKDNALVAKNSGVPMVFGSQSITKIYNNDNMPSLIIPSLGMLSDSGKHQDYTLEFWLRTNNASTEQKRIIGPIASQDGIYLHGPFLLLKIDDKYGSYYVGKWERPMLMHLRYTNNQLSLLLNGEEIITITINSNTISLPSAFDENNKSQNWIGFYAYEKIEPIEIDCVAIYPYVVPSIVAKRRFVFGQGVQYPQNLNSIYGGDSVLFDYSFADYTKNYNYPDLGSWSQASIDNLIIEDNMLTIPNTFIPQIFTNNFNKKEQDMFNDQNLLSENLYLSLRPNNSWNLVNSYIYFDNFSLYNQITKAVYGLFEVPTSFTGTQVLMRIEDNNSNYFSIECVNDKIKYILKYNSVIKDIYECSRVNALSSTNLDDGEPGETENIIFAAGLELDKFSNHFGDNIISFFTNQSTLKLYVGGTKEFEKTFTGKIYKVGICSEKNLLDIDNLFNEIGVPVDYENIFDLYEPGIDFDGGLYNQDNIGWSDSIGETNQLLYEDENDITIPILENYSYSPSLPDLRLLKDHTPSVGIIPKKYFNKFYLDATVSGSWKDYVPLSYFGQNVVDEYGNQVFELDFIQFNVNYPASVKFKESETIDPNGWPYSELSAEYSFPQQRSYASLDNFLYTGYLNYEDLQQKSIKKYTYDTSNEIVKTYITFEYLEEGANAEESFFIRKEDVPKNGVIEPGSNWINTKYEVVDNVIIYPPSGVNFNDLAIVLHIEVDINGIRYSPLKIKNLQLASQAFNYNGANSVGTRFGVPVYPYKSTGYYFDYKTKNPFSIYKGSSPYLYLTRDSGLEIRGSYDPLINRGVALSINPSKIQTYEIMAMQSLIRFNSDFFPYAPTQIMQINAKNKIIKLYMVANHPSGKRAKIYAIDGNTGGLYNAISFYLNGKIVKEPVININEWSLLGIGFSDILNFKSYTGSIMINGPIIFNALSYYQTTNLQEVKNVTKRPWARVRFSADGIYEWEYWNDFYMWDGVLVQSSSSYYGVDPEDLYKSYTGTNKIIIEDDSVFGIQGYEYSIFKDVTWQSQISNAV